VSVERRSTRLTGGLGVFLGSRAAFGGRYPRRVLIPFPENLLQAGPMATTSTSNKHGYSATKDQLLTRLRRIEGQVRGVQGMVADDRYCIDVVTQISAIQAALDKVALGLLDDHARHCVIDGRAEGSPEELTDELMAAVGRLMRRG
jgi:CsoR family transcriptional regulator, copper-sensing transcriptional repressor